MALASGGLHYIGLDYANVRAGLDGAGITVTPALWTGLTIMEAEFRKTANSR